MLENSTEKTFALKGIPEAINRASVRILTQLAETYDRVIKRPPVLYDPAVAHHPTQAQQYMTYPVVDPYTGMTQMAQVPVPSGIPAPAPVADQTSIVVPVPESLVGTIIGKKGASITEIRQRSGAQIKIADAVPSSQERIITITGTPYANESALAMLYEKMNSANLATMHKL